AACWAMGILVLALLAPLNLLLKRRPEDLGLEPDGDRSSRDDTAGSGTANVVDAAWVAVDWTLARAMRTDRFWWIMVGYFCGLFDWYAVQIHQTKYLVEVGFSPGGAAGPWVTGVLHDATGSYTLAFWIAIGCSVLSALAIWLAAPREVRAVAGRAHRRP